MRVAYIGVGHHHYPVYLRPLLGMAEHKVVGLSDRDHEVARAEAEQIGCAWFGDYRELIRKERPDFVFALGRHCDMAEEANYLLDEGIPFAIEKPAGTSYVEVSALADRASQKGSFAAVGLAMRESDLAQLIQKDLADDVMQYVFFRWFGPSSVRYHDPRWKWLLDPREAGGGALINLGVHHIDWFRILIGKHRPSVTGAIMANLAEGGAAEDYSLVSLKGNGALGVLETGYLSPGQLTVRPDGMKSWIAAPANPVEMHYVIRTDRHHITVHDLQTAAIVDLKTGVTKHAKGTTTQNYDRFTRNVLDRVKAGQVPVADLADMAEVMRIVQDAYLVAGRLASDGVAAGAAR